MIKFLENCYSKSVIAFDCETNSLNAKTTDLVGISLSCEEGLACYIPLRHGQKLDDNQSDFNFDNVKSFNQIHFEDAIELLKPILEDKSILKIGHNNKFDALVVKQPHNGSINIDPIGDTMCLSYVVDSGRVDNHKLDSMALRELNHNTIKYEDICGKGKNKILFNQLSPSDALDYASEDADITLAIYNRVLPRIFNDKKYSVYKRLENPLINTLDISVGYSHNIVFEIPAELKVTAETEKGQPPVVTISGKELGS